MTSRMTLVRFVGKWKKMKSDVFSTKSRSKSVIERSIDTVYVLSKRCIVRITSLSLRSYAYGFILWRILVYTTKFSWPKSGLIGGKLISGHVQFWKILGSTT